MNKLLLLLKRYDQCWELNIAKITSQQEKPICPNCKNKFPQDTKNRQSAKITSRKNFVPHGILLDYKICVMFYYD